MITLLKDPLSLLLGRLEAERDGCRPDADPNNDPNKRASSSFESALPPVPSLESILQVGCVASSVDEEWDDRHRSSPLRHLLWLLTSSVRASGLSLTAFGDQMFFAGYCCCCLSFITSAGNYKSGVAAGGCCFLPGLGAAARAGAEGPATRELATAAASAA